MSQENASRLQSIDIFRGITMALMLMVNNPGNPATIPPQLEHAAWNGFTLADLVFPFFIFIMGVTVPLAINGRLHKGAGTVNVVLHICRRSLLLFGLGLVINGFPFYDWATLRIPGVLQRIAAVYFVSALLFLLCRRLFPKERRQLIALLGAALFLLLFYYLLLRFVPVPGYGSGSLEPQGNLVQYIDLHWLRGHLYRPDWDPEGILSTLPAISSGLIGMLAGMTLVSPSHKPPVKIAVFLGSGLAFLFLAQCLQAVFPYNKNLWSSSYVLLTSGFAILFLACLYLLADILNSGRLLLPFQFIGSSAIFVYFVSEIIRRSLWLVPVKDSLTGTTLDFKIWLGQRLIAPWAHGLDSFYFSLFYVVFWLAVMGLLYLRKIYIRL